jgi:hypothetical protein
MRTRGRRIEVCRYASHAAAKRKAAQPEPRHLVQLGAHGRSTELACRAGQVFAADAIVDSPARRTDALSMTHSAARTGLLSGLRESDGFARDQRDGLNWDHLVAG